MLEETLRLIRIILQNDLRIRLLIFADIYYKSKMLSESLEFNEFIFELEILGPAQNVLRKV